MPAQNIIETLIVKNRSPDRMYTVIRRREEYRQRRDSYTDNKLFQSSIIFCWRFSAKFKRATLCALVSKVASQVVLDAYQLPANNLLASEYSTPHRGRLKSVFEALLSHPEYSYAQKSVIFLWYPSFMALSWSFAHVSSSMVLLYWSRNGRTINAQKIGDIALGPNIFNQSYKRDGRFLR